MIAVDRIDSWVENHSSIKCAPSWLLNQRENALAQFAETGLPGVRDEQWRYTNLRALKQNSFSLSTPTSLTVELPVSNQPRLVFVDGFLDADQSTAINGVSITSLSSRLALENNTLEAVFSSCLPHQQHGFTSLNSAYAQDGYVVELANNTVLESVLEVYFISQSVDTVSHTRNIILAGANSQCTIIERHLGRDGDVYLSNHITEIVAGDNAHIDHYKLQQQSNDGFHVGGVFINQSRSSNVKSHNVTLGGLVTRNDVHTNLLGEGAHMEMNGLVLGTGRQHIDNHTEVNHAVPNCTSDEYYKTVLDDRSRSVFRGRIIVAEDAQQTIADQQNNNLLLSRDAEADTKPQLEIYADDVKCSHGATVGQLDETSLFYLQSRGIDTESARGLLTFAFANEVVERINVESVKAELTQLIAGELLSGLEELV